VNLTQRSDCLCIQKREDSTPGFTRFGYLRVQGAPWSVTTWSRFAVNSKLPLFPYQKPVCDNNPMTRHQTNLDWDLAEETKRAEERELECIRHVAQLNERWLEDHRGRAQALEAKLIEEAPNGGASDKLLVSLMAHDYVLSEALGHAEALLAVRISTMVDNCRVVTALAKALRETTICRSSTERRIQQVMQTRVILRGQRRIAEIVPLRRVA